MLSVMRNYPTMRSGIMIAIFNYSICIFKIYTIYSKALCIMSAPRHRVIVCNISFYNFYIIFF